MDHGKKSGTLSNANLIGYKEKKVGAPLNPNSKAAYLRNLISPEMGEVSIRVSERDRNYVGEIVRGVARAKGFKVRARYVRTQSKLYVKKVT